MMEELLAPLRLHAAPNEPSRFVLVTMAAGLSIARIQEMAEERLSRHPHHAQHAALSVGAGMIQYCDLPTSPPRKMAEFLKPDGPRRAGWMHVPESLIDAASCVSGCGPAWVYQFIEALADGGVACGLPRAKAQDLRRPDAVLGGAELVLESGATPRRTEGRGVQPPAAAPSRACGCWKKRACGAR